MGAGTAGAVFDAISRMRRAERELARPRIGYVRGRPQRDLALDRLPFPCFFLCDACGRLEEGSSTDPMRRDGEDGHPPGPCPACQATAWIDLQQETMALAYRELEAMHAREHDEKGWYRSLWIGAAASTVVIGALVLCASMFADIGGMLLRGLAIWGFIATWIASSVGLRLLTRRSRPVQARPRRWRHPLPGRAGPARRSARGVAVGDPSLRAPLSGTPCLGWSVQVWSDEGQLLDEQRHVAFAVDGEAFEPDSVRLELETRVLRPHDDDESFTRFLQRRGLSPHDQSLQVHEACLVAGAAVGVEPRDPAKGGLVLRASACALAA